MTIEEAMVKYGNEARGRYVFCECCPVEQPCGIQRATGYYDCWEHIAKVMTEREAENIPVETASAIDHPSHYAGEKYECIEVMREVFGDEAVRHFCLLNAFKYLWRCGKKHESPDEDIKKDIWYLNKYLATKEENA